jgi:hypothetical protein
MNVHTSEIVPWDSLTDEQKASGDWIKLPAHDLDGHCDARRRTMLDDLLPAQPARVKDFASRSRIAGAPGHERRGTFDALGRPKI